MKPDVTEAAIRDIFISDGGELARKLHAHLYGDFKDDSNLNTTVHPLLEKLARESPLYSGGFKHWDQVILKDWARRKPEWPGRLKQLKVLTLWNHRFPQTRHAVLWWLEETFPEWVEPAFPELTRADEEEHSEIGPGFDPITGRRTAKKDYGEKEAMRWARRCFPSAQVEKVADWNPKQGYDVRVTLADGRELHIEAKATQGNGDKVHIEEGERCHNLDNLCKAGHVLFVISGVDCKITDGKWECTGGEAKFIHDWRIDKSDLKPTRYRYTVPHHLEVSADTEPVLPDVDSA
jgi:hypothetical protein